MTRDLSTSQNRTKTVHLFLGLFLYYGIIFVLSHLPGDTFKNIGFNIWDKAAHAILYFPLGVLISAFILRLKKELQTLLVVALSLAVVFVLGSLDEFHQSFVPGRVVSFLDVVADVIGGVLGTAATIFFNRRYLK